MPEGLVGRQQLGGTDGRAVLAHRAAVTVALWRDLGAELEVHHVDGDPSNNSLANLQVLTHAEHNRAHRSRQLFVGFCPGCWRLFCWRQQVEPQVFCSYSCAAIAQRGTDPDGGDPEQAAAAKQGWVLKSYYAYLAGAPMPPPFREPEELPEPAPSPSCAPC
jgi:hypothetical protein